ncbi:hypothetical protein H2203_001342 [Taxawa tesnikishii (nom. ined.)]|nr:hypothetical protein H2203_001342 [Dothideales sp. JES 119]
MEVLKKQDHGRHPQWDILISNPPYISPQAFNRTTSRSVRNFEPKLALVPSPQPISSPIDPGDVFYPRLLTIAKAVDAKLVLFEVADLEQAQRVASMVQKEGIWERTEIWRDDPTTSEEGWSENVANNGTDDSVLVRGRGNGRSVVASRGEALQWVKESQTN